MLDDVLTANLKASSSCDLNAIAVGVTPFKGASLLHTVALFVIYPKTREPLITENSSACVASTRRSSQP